MYEQRIDFIMNVIGASLSWLVHRRERGMNQGGGHERRRALSLAQTHTHCASTCPFPTKLD
jgi:hypothetical protein